MNTENNLSCKITGKSILSNSYGNFPKEGYFFVPHYVNVACNIEETDCMIVIIANVSDIYA